MTNDSLPSPDGAINQATRFGERFGFPALVSAILIIGLMYGAYFIIRYEVFYNREKAQAVEAKVDMIVSQHVSMASKLEAQLELQAKQISINCAQCWNVADNQTEIKRCACTPPSIPQ